MKLINWASALLKGDGHPLTPEDRPLWAAADTLDDLGDLTARWLNGSIASQPGYYGECDVDEDEAPGLTSALIELNRAGYVTRSSQAGYNGLGHDGGHWRLCAAVEGFAAPATAERLQQAIARTRLETCTWPCLRYGRRGDGVAVTYADDLVTTTFGRQLRRRDVASELDGCGPGAVAAACAAVQLTVLDPLPSDNHMWAVLRDAAAGLRHRGSDRG